ncbi:MAG: hypothetical protein ACTIJ6_09115 [Leucobacter sp.]
MGTTTIKVPVQLRDRINRDAQERGLTASGLIEGLLDGYERRQRMEAFGRAFRGAGDEYWDEFQAWDTISPNDGADD